MSVTRVVTEPFQVAPPPHLYHAGQDARVCLSVCCRARASAQDHARGAIDASLLQRLQAATGGATLSASER